MLSFETLTLTGRPNCWLVAPPGLCKAAAPHQAAPFFEAMAAPRLYDAWLRVLARQPRVAVIAQDREALAIEAVQRTALLRFVDDVSARFMSAPGGATLAVYSRSRVGYSDLGVNRKRVQAFLAELGAEIARP